MTLIALDFALAARQAVPLVSIALMMRCVKVAWHLPSQNTDDPEVCDLPACRSPQST